MATPSPPLLTPADAFTWTSLIGPAVVAAVISGLVSAIGILISARTARRIHTERLAFERDQAERKFKYDVGVTEAKIRADLTLAEKKAALDQALAVWRRRYDLAEQVMIAAHEARDALTWACVRVVFSGEGETRQASEEESEELRKRRNSDFVPLERLSKAAKSFATLETLRYAVSAHFGHEAVGLISAFTEAHNEITAAASHLIHLATWGDDPMRTQSLFPFRDALWGEGLRLRDEKVAAAIAGIEAMCRPALSEKPPT